MKPQWTVKTTLRALALVLAATVIPGLAAPGVASAAGPSVELPKTTPVAAQRQTIEPRNPDAASTNAITGDRNPLPGKDGGGTSAATSLAPSSTWDVSAYTGDFTWSYPLRVPPAPGGLEPTLALSYRSSAVDGHTSVTNNQPSWIGDGWDLSPGFVERTYGTCADDGDPGPQTGDLCWRNDNATAAYGGGGGMLICCDGEHRWRAESDDGSRIERLNDPVLAAPLDGDNDGEYWRITTTDGTQYFFGSQVDTKSTWTVPVFGDDPGEPCNQAGSFDNSSCRQSWRWNLDKVVDRNGNVIRYFYDTESNSYGLNKKDAAVSYIRGGTLNRIEYGLNTGVSGQATGRVEFTTADRCLPGSVCSTTDPARRGNFPDTPLEQSCVTSTCTEHSPSFWSTKRLSVITTKVLRGSTYAPVDRYTLDQQYPDPGDGERAALWLKAIKHTGLAGGELDLPAITFEGSTFPNRVKTLDGTGPMLRYRITAVVSESGGVTSVAYESDCRADLPAPAAETNASRCFPVRWAPRNHEPILDYFHKYTVRQVSQSDRLKTGLSSSTAQVTSYEYLDGAAWHFDRSEFVKEQDKTWNEFRGFGRVRVRSGAGGDKITMTEQRFYRGMNGDKLNSNGGTKSVTLRDSEGLARVDDDWLRGFGYETRTYEREAPSTAPEPPLLGKTITDPSVQGPFATRGVFQSRIVRSGVQRGFTKLAVGWRVTRSEMTYDDRGLPLEVDDLGDATTAADDRCTRTRYLPNAEAWLLDLPSTVETVAVNCATPARFPEHAISATRTSYDGQAEDKAPTKGNPTRTEIAKEHALAKPAYITAATAGYDVHGRVVTATDAAGSRTTIGFTPETGGPVTKITTTSPPTTAVPTGLVTTAELDPAFGQPTLTTDPNNRITQIAYDPLGRKTEVWLPNREKTPTTQGSIKFAYRIRTDGPNVVTTTAIGPNNNYTSSKTLFDGLLRPRQVQSPAVGGGRLIVDTRYDTAGRVFKTTQPYFNDASIDDELWVASDTEVPGLTRTEFDGAGRPIASIYQAGAFEKWRSTTEYGGDRVTVTPPLGGTTTTTITDARGRTTELRQYRTAASTGAFDTTGYKYTPAGQLAEVTGPDGAIWKFGYDLRGNKITSQDPDTGLSTLTYNDAGQLTSTTDARGKTLAYHYDALGRKTAMHQDSLQGTQLAEWVFDTAGGGKGQLASSTRFVDERPYTTTVGSYDQLYQPYNSTVTIPAAPETGLLAGNYQWFGSYDHDGGLSGETYPAAGGLDAETVNYEKDDFGRLKSSSGGYNARTVELVTATNYTRYGELERLQLGENTKHVWQSFYYDTNTRRPKRSIVDAELPKPMQSDIHYNYDPAGNITSIADLTLDQPADDIQCFRHDHVRRLTEAWTAARANWKEENGCTAGPTMAAGPAPYWQSYVHGPGGNRVQETQRTPTATATRTYTYEPQQPHTLRSVSGPAGTETYTYDPAGYTKTRVKPGVNQTLNWDAEGHLASVTGPGETTSYVYTADGARLLRKDSTGTALYLGNQEIHLSAAGGSPVATRYYTAGGQTIAMRKGAALTWLAADHQGTAGLTINTTTLTVTRRRQLPYGSPRGNPVTWPNDRAFLGGTLDASTGLTHLGAREYDPTTGRFISVDPIMDLSNPQTMHGYAYANNNPITFMDPSGLAFTNAPDGECARGCGYKPGQGPASKCCGTPAAKPPVLGSDAPGGGRVNANGTPMRTGCGGRGGCAPNGTPPVTAPAPKMCTGPTGYGSQRCGGDECPAGKQWHNGYSVSGCIDIRGGSPDPNIAHAILDICGSTSIPIVSQICDGANGLAYLVEGDLINAAGSGLGLVPGVGDAVTAGRAADNLAHSVKAACSFDDDTEVLMADGTTKPISKIKEGDQVLAADPETGEKGPRTVTAVLVHDDTVLDLVTEDGSVVTTTEDHPFWNETDRRWQRADELDNGDSLLDATGGRIRVTGLRVSTVRVVDAYNLTVQELHTYFVVVGATPVLVHNTCPAFRPGEWYIDSVTLSDGKSYEFAALNVRVDDDRLILDNVIISPVDGSVDWQKNRKTLGMAGAMELRRLLRDRYGQQAASQGFDYLVLNFERSTGNPGHVGTIEIWVGG